MTDLQDSLMLPSFQSNRGKGNETGIETGKENEMVTENPKEIEKENETVTENRTETGIGIEKEIEIITEKGTEIGKETEIKTGIESDPGAEVRTEKNAPGKERIGFETVKTEVARAKTENEKEKIAAQKGKIEVETGKIGGTGKKDTKLLCSNNKLHLMISIFFRLRYLFSTEYVFVISV